MRSLTTGASYPGATPSKKAIKRLRDNVRGLLCRQNRRPVAEVVGVLNRKLMGWASYFRYGSVLRLRQNLDMFVYDRMRRWLRRRHKVGTSGWRRFPQKYVYGQLGVVSLDSLPRAANA
jgi:RNA-directed DNA polymerase